MPEYQIGENTLSDPNGSTTSHRTTPPSKESEKEIDFIDLLLPIIRAKKRIALTVAAFFIVGVAIALSMKNVYTATAVIMTPQQEQSVASALLGQLGPLGGMAAGSALGLKNPADMYVGLLQSRMVADHIIDANHLEAAFKRKTRTDTRDALRSRSAIEVGNDNLIYIRITDRNPALAASIANGYVDELHRLNSRLGAMQATQRRQFYDDQLQQEQKALAAAEESLKQTETQLGVIHIGGQTEMTIRTIATTQAQIAQRQVILSNILSYATDQNPEAIRVKQEINALQQQLAKLENSNQTFEPGNVALSAGKVPAAQLEYLRKYRDLRYHESLFELLGKQREIAGLDEAKSAPVIQVVDSAEVPERKSGPHRSLIVMGFIFAGFLLSSSIAILADRWQRMANDPSYIPRMHTLSSALKTSK